ncbi:MAG: hypothetical protein HYW50_02350 [Candidatus Diapherotrites archaeon]|nr:hypothetical protein [Candidatus Diapherotrites archaeon]
MRRKLLLVRKPFTTPELAEWRKRTIEHAFKRNQVSFRRIYENMRLKYQSLFAGLVVELKRHGIKVKTEQVQVKTTRREKTGHLHQKVSGIYFEGSVDFAGASKLINEYFEKLEELNVQLNHFVAVAKNNGVELHSVPADILVMLEAIRLKVKSRGTDRAF